MGALIVLVSIYALIVSIYLGIAYVKYNKKGNSIGKTGQEIARNVLDANGLEHIKVSKCGSFLFGNSYSHYFKKVRLRRFTWKKSSVSSLAMAVQKSALAVLDKENDPDMKKRIRLTPIIFAGPLAFIPLAIIGAAIDLLAFKAGDVSFTLLLSIVGLVFYTISFVMSLLVLKTEKKAQKKAIEIMETENLATDEELVMMQKLFKLYNIEYVNNMILALLELVFRILSIVANVQNINSPTSD